MPTFASIGLHPQLRSRLVTVSSGIANNNNDNINNASESAASMFVMIDTPQALLSRNPQSIRLLLNNNSHDNNNDADADAVTSSSNEEYTQVLSSSHVNSLRRQVAQRLVEESSSFGKHARHVTQTVIQDDDHHQKHDNDTRNKRQRRNMTARTTILPGSVSLLHLVKYQQITQQTQDKSRFYFSTSCPALDDMLALPPEYNHHLHDNNHDNNNGNGNGNGGGIPLGLVTQFSGASGTGKTQLALQLIVQAAAANTTTTPTLSSSSLCWYFCSNATEPLALARRLADLAITVGAGQQQQQHPGVHKNYNMMMTQVLKDTIFQTVTNEYQLLAGLAKMEETIVLQQQERQQEKHQHRNGGDCRHPHLLLIIDSISICMSSSCCTMENPLVPKVALTLKRLARQFSMAVVLLNGSNNSSSGSSSSQRQQQRQPALGTLWNNLAPDIHVMLEPFTPAMSNDDDDDHQQQQQATQIIRARLERHFAKQCGSGSIMANHQHDTASSCYFCITNGGVKQVSFP